MFFFPRLCFSWSGSSWLFLKGSMVKLLKLYFLCILWLWTVLGKKITHTELSSVLLVVAALVFLETHILSLLTTRFIVRNGFDGAMLSSLWYFTITPYFILHIMCCIYKFNMSKKNAWTAALHTWINIMTLYPLKYTELALPQRILLHFIIMHLCKTKLYSLFPESLVISSRELCK